MIKLDLQLFGGCGGGSGMSGGGGGRSEVVNGNRISTDGDGGYIVASANGSWDGYEMYDSYREARRAAMES